MYPFLSNTNRVSISSCILEGFCKCLWTNFEQFYYYQSYLATRKWTIEWIQQKKNTNTINNNKNKANLWMQWNERANKNCPKRVPKHLQDPTKTQLHKKLVDSVKNVNCKCTVFVSMFWIVNSQPVYINSLSLAKIP